MTRVAGVDLGGTNITVGLVDDDFRVVDDAKVPTPRGPDPVVDAIVAAVQALDADVAAVGVGAPGPVSDGMVLTAPNLPGWGEAVPLARRLRDSLGLPVEVENDATAGTVGEWRAGAGRGSDHLLGVWLGTGVGGGLVLDGRPYRGASGAAGELGHVPVRLDGAQCGCGLRGCVEAYAGRASMERTVRLAAGAGRPTAMLDIAADAGKERLTAKVWSRALDGEDPLAVAVFGEAVAAVGAGVAAAVNLLDLDTVVLGGGLTERFGERLTGRVLAATRAHLLVADKPLRVAVAELGDDSGMVGAAALALDALG
ncbi:MAG: ROK family protein [Actinomycetota bacterium]|nr:ROK family protein [Actinomycetota bacterium]